jgi:hypothetical protein
MHCVRSAILQTIPLTRCEFATPRERLIKIGARVIEQFARIRVQVPTLPAFSATTSETRRPVA